MRLGIGRISGIRAKLTRSGRETAVLSAMRDKLLSPVRGARGALAGPGLRIASGDNSERGRKRRRAGLRKSERARRSDALRASAARLWYQGPLRIARTQWEVWT